MCDNFIKLFYDILKLLAVKFLIAMLCSLWQKLTALIIYAANLIMKLI